jgi:hypothetical protein
VAQNTMAETPINLSITNWILSNKYTINSVANTLGVPSTAIAAAAAEEASHIIYDRTIFGYYLWSHENFKDHIQDSLATIYSNQAIQDNFTQRKAAIVRGENPAISGYPSWMPSWVPGGRAFDHEQNPTKMDVGWYNLNVGNSVLVLNRYLAQTGSGGKYEGDPLGLSQYANDLGQFAADIASNKDVGWKLIGLNIQQANTLFTNAYGNQYTRLTGIEQTELLITAYKQGIGKITKKIEARKSKAALNGEGLPQLPDPAAGDGAPFVAKNYSTLQKLLTPQNAALFNPDGATYDPQLLDILNSPALNWSAQIGGFNFENTENFNFDNAFPYEDNSAYWDLYYNYTALEYGNSIDDDSDYNNNTPEQGPVQYDSCRFPMGPCWPTPRPRWT